MWLMWSPDMTHNTDMNHVTDVTYDMTHNTDMNHVTDVISWYDPWNWHEPCDWCDPWYN